MSRVVLHGQVRGRLLLQVVRVARLHRQLQERVRVLQVWRLQVVLDEPSLVLRVLAEAGRVQVLNEPGRML